MHVLKLCTRLHYNTCSQKAMGDSMIFSRAGFPKPFVYAKKMLMASEKQSLDETTGCYQRFQEQIYN